MGRALWMVGALFVVCLAAFSAVIFATRDEDDVAIDFVLSEKLTFEIARSEELRRDVAFAALTDFSWDRLYIVEPRTPPGVINQALGFRFNADVGNFTTPLLIFVEDGRLERFTDYRGEGRFEGIPEPVAAFSRDEAVFSVRALVMTPKRPGAAAAP